MAPRTEALAQTIDQTLLDEDAPPNEVGSAMTVEFPARSAPLARA